MAVQHIKQITEMRENGMTYQSIANEIGISRQQVWYTAKIAGIAGNNQKIDKVIYKGIKEWLTKHKMRLHDFCIKCGEEVGAGSKTYRFLIGENPGNISVIRNIINSCGLTFEEAFGEIVDEDKA